MDAIGLYTDFSCVREVLVGDAGSTDGTREFLDTYEFVDKVYDVPYGSVASNLRRGAELGTGKYILTMDNDVIVPDQWNRLALNAIIAGAEHGIRMIGCEMPDGHLEEAIYGDPGRALPFVNLRYLHREQIECDGFTIQPTWHVGGIRVAERELFLSKNQFGYLGNGFGEDDSPYFGFWRWHLGFQNQLAVLIPRMGCLVTEFIKNARVPDALRYSSYRLSEPLEPIVREALGQPLSELREEYIAKGWMRDFDFDLRGRREARNG